MKFVYGNHKGETEERDVTPIALLYLHEPGAVNGYLYAYNPGWFLECITHDRANELRHFALDHIVTLGGPQVLRWPLPTGMDMKYGNPYEGQASIDYFDGHKVGQNNELFDFGASSAWAHGFNDGRRFLLDGPKIATPYPVSADSDPLGR